jgi:hypothetical protein
MASQTSLLIFMVAVLFGAGLIGFQSFEGLGVHESFYTTVSVLTFTGADGLSGQGRLLASFLSLGAVAVLVWAFVNLHHKPTHKVDVSEEIEDFFKFMPPNQKLAIKDVQVARKSRIAGKRKSDILRLTGSVVFAVKKGAVYDVNVPFSQRIKGGSKVLVMGNQKQIKDFEKEGK